MKQIANMLDKKKVLV